MTDQELEQKLRQALEHAAPDDIDGILSRCGPREENVIPLSAPQKRRWRAAPWVAAACLVLAAGGGFLGVRYQQAGAVASVVSLDVNPSVRLEINRAEKVLSAMPVNEDAALVLDGMDLTGTDLEVAVNAIIGSLLKHGYVDELANSVLISVEDEDRARGAALEEKLTGDISQVLESASVNGAILSQTFAGDQALRQQAEEYGISMGKAALIQTLVDSSTHLSFGSLAGLSINELNLLANSAAATDRTGEIGETAPIPSTGTASQEGYIGADAAKQAALAHAGTAADQVRYLEAEYDFEDGRMIYEVEFTVNGAEYEYDIDAATGAVLRYEGGEPDEGALPGGQTVQQPVIGEAAARDIALTHAGVRAAETRELEVELEDNIYQVEFQAGQYEYEYRINAHDGSILGVERDN